MDEENNEIWSAKDPSDDKVELIRGGRGTYDLMMHNYEGIYLGTVRLTKDDLFRLGDAIEKERTR